MLAWKSAIRDTTSATPQAGSALRQVGCLLEDINSFSLTSTPTTMWQARARISLRHRGTCARCNESCIQIGERVIYCDYNATTPLRSEALEAMLPFLRGEFGNPSSVHALGSHAR